MTATCDALAGDAVDDPIPQTTSQKKDRIGLGERVIPATVFGLLDVLAIRAFLNDLTSVSSAGATVHQMLVLAQRGVYVLFVSLIIALFMARTPARSSDTRFSSWLVAVIGTFGLAATPLLPSGPLLVDTGVTGASIGLAFSVVALSLALVTLATLGHSFGITPQARTLVTSGPYRYVRHPLYLCESLTILALVLVSGQATGVVACVVVIGCQFRRAWLEERLLGSVFPEYEDAFSGVRHLVPGVY